MLVKISTALKGLGVSQMKRFPILLTLLVSLIFLVPSLVWSHPYLKIEPSLPVRVDWGLMPNGMLHVSYDMDQNGKAEFHSLRVVKKSFPSRESVDSVEKHFPNSLIFYVELSSCLHYYVAVSHPLLYAVDVDEDGLWDLVYKDVSQDGVNGNEIFYESPSGIFTAAIANF